MQEGKWDWSRRAWPDSVGLDAHWWGPKALLKLLKCNLWFFCMGRGTHAKQGLIGMFISILLMQRTVINSKLHRWKLEFNVLTYSRVTGSNFASVLGTKCFEGRRNSSNPTAAFWLFRTAPWWDVCPEPRLLLECEAQRFTVLVSIKM